MSYVNVGLDIDAVYKGIGLKDAYSSSQNLRATKRHLSYGITQCYLPLDTGERV